jgi:hypothetical protein
MLGGIRMRTNQTQSKALNKTLKPCARWEDRMEKDHKLLASGIENPKFYSARNGKKPKPSPLAPKCYSARNGD